MPFARLKEWVAAESKSFLAKEALKYILLTIASFVGAWLLTFFTALFHLGEPLTWDALKARAIELALAVASHPYESTVGLIQRDPPHSIAGVLLVATGFVLVVLFRRARNKIHQQSVRLTEVAKAVALVEQAGLGGRWPHARYGVADSAPWDDIRQEILHPHNGYLYLLGANGIDTFGSPGSPLFDTLHQFRRTVRVVLVSPTSAEAQGRANAVGVNPQVYRDAIAASVRRLETLREQQHPIDGRYYDGQPNWKLIITSRAVWMQYYMPGGLHVDHTPCWRFDLTPADNGLYHYFSMEFDRIWRRCRNEEMFAAG